MAKPSASQVVTDLTSDTVKGTEDVTSEYDPEQIPDIAEPVTGELYNTYNLEEMNHG